MMTDLSRDATTEVSKPAVHHHWLVLPDPFASNQSDEVQKICGVIRNAVVGPRQVLNLSDLSLLLTLNKRKEDK